MNRGQKSRKCSSNSMPDLSSQQNHELISTNRGLKWDYRGANPPPLVKEQPHRCLIVKKPFRQVHSSPNLVAMASEFFKVSKKEDKNIWSNDPSKVDEKLSRSINISAKAYSDTQVLNEFQLEQKSDHNINVIGGRFNISMRFNEEESPSKKVIKKGNQNKDFSPRTHANVHKNYMSRAGDAVKKLTSHLKGETTALTNENDNEVLSMHEVAELMKHDKLLWREFKIEVTNSNAITDLGMMAVLGKFISEKEDWIKIRNEERRVKEIIKNNENQPDKAVARRRLSWLKRKRRTDCQDLDNLTVDGSSGHRSFYIEDDNISCVSCPTIRLKTHP